MITHEAPRFFHCKNFGDCLSQHGPSTTTTTTTPAVTREISRSNKSSSKIALTTSLARGWLWWILLRKKFILYQFDSFLTQCDDTQQKSWTADRDLQHWSALTNSGQTARLVTWWPPVCPGRQVMQIFRVCQAWLSLFSSSDCHSFTRKLQLMWELSTPRYLTALELSRIHCYIHRLPPNVFSQFESCN